jgi:two-component system, OmpR family, sensor kinase
MRRWSFRAKLTVWWTLGFGLLLAVANLAIYAAFRSYLESNLDLKVGTVAASELASSIDGLDIHLHEVPQGALAQGAYTEKFVQILEADGRVRLASASLRSQSPLASPALVRAALDGRPTLLSVDVGGRQGRATVLNARMGEHQYAILVGLYRDQIDAHLAQLAWLLAAVWLAALGATSALGYWLASAALAPVAGITRRAARIAKGEFSTRLDPPTSQDEVGQMTHSLNEVLDRLYGALEAHRRFASDASHELRAPITAMAGEIEIALKRSRTADEYKEALLVVQDRLSSLTALCEDLILLVHAQEGAQAWNCVRSRCCRSCRRLRPGWRTPRRPGASRSRRAIFRTSLRTPTRGCSLASSTTCSPTPCTTTGTVEESSSVARRRRVHRTNGRLAPR